MKSKEMTVFDINSEEYQFDSFCFNQYVDHKAKNEKIRKGDIENILAQKISVSSSAIHNWRFGCNGPSGIELIKDVADLLAAIKAVATNDTPIILTIDMSISNK